jgi:hypothetical protein
MESLPTFEPYVLSPLDHNTGPIHLSGFFTFYLKSPAVAIQVLEDGVLCLIKSLPFLAGNVTASSQLPGKENVYEVQPPTAEILQDYPMLRIRHHKQAVAPDSPSGNFSYDSLLNEDFVPLPFTMAAEELSPVLRFQANIMQDGVILCLCFHHMAMDGTGVTNVLTSLAEFCRNPRLGLSALQTDPYKEAQTRRMILEAGNAQGVHSELHSHFGAMPELSNAPVSRILILDPEKIRYLREAITTLLRGRLGIQDISLSNHVIVSAVLWLGIIRSRYGPMSPKDQKDSHLLTMSEVRNILQPALPHSYIGNALAFVETHFSIERVLSHSSSSEGQLFTSNGVRTSDINLLAEMALSIDKVLHQVTDKYVRNLISRISTSSDWTVSPRAGDLSLSSIRNLNFYDIDFGPHLGSVRHFDIPENRIAGLSWVLPARFSGSSAPWEIRLPLEPAVMERLQMDTLIKWASLKNLSKL